MICPVLVGHQHGIGHAGNGGVERHLLLAQQIGGALALAQVGIQLLDHQGDRAVGAAAVALGLLVGGIDQLAQQLDIDLAGGRGRLRQLSAEQLVHPNYLTASEIVVTVIV